MMRATTIRWPRPAGAAEGRRPRPASLYLWLVPVCVWGLVCWSAYAIDMSPTGRLDRSGHLKGHDFLHFYVLGDIGRARATADLYDFDAHARRTDALVPEYAHRFLPIHTPQVAMFFAPLARLPYVAALTTWLLVSTLLYALCVAALTRALPALRGYGHVVALAAAASPAAYALIASGQTSSLALALLTAAYFAARSGRSFVLGLCLGSLAYKPTFGLLLPVIWIAARDWRALAGGALAAAVQTAAAAAYFGPGVVGAYLAHLGTVPGQLALLEAQPWLMHTLSAFFKLLVPWPAVAAVLTAVGAIGVAVVAARVWASRAPLDLRFSALVIATVLVSPHLYGYDLVVLTPALLLSAAWAIEQARIDVPMIAAGYMAFLVPAFDGLARLTHVQVSVVAMVVWLALVARPGRARQPLHSVAQRGTTNTTRRVSTL